MLALSLFVTLGAALWAWEQAANRILITDAIARVHRVGGADTVQVTMKIENAGGPDVLLRAHSDEAKLANFRNAPTDLPIPAGASPSLSADGVFLLLLGIQGALDEGRLIPITLEFRNAGEVAVKARLVSGLFAHAMDRRIEIAPVPALSLTASPTESGWRFTADAPGFTFAPERMDQPHRAGEGHAHLYIDGLKIARMTAPVIEIGALPPGPHKARITLNTNDHQLYVSQGEPIEAEADLNAE